MKMLIIMRGFFPGKKYGGPPVSIHNLCSLLKEYEFYIICKDHDIDSKDRYSNIVEGWNSYPNYNVLYLSDKQYNIFKFKIIINTIKPDWIYLQSIFDSSTIPCLALSRIYDIKCILAPRGELCLGAIKKKYYKKIPYIFFLRNSMLLNNITFQSTSQEETEAIKHYLKIRTSQIKYLTNIPSLPERNLFHKDKISGIGHFVFLARIHPQKNLLDVISYFYNISSHAIIDIYGPIEDKQYWQNCIELIKKLPQNIKIQYCGLITHDKVHETIAKYDSFILPSHGENFGHSIAEALLSETPVIISDQTPWTDVNENNAGWAFSLSKKEDFVNAIQKIIAMNQEELMNIRKSIAHYIQNKLKINELYDKYTSILK